MNLQQFQQDGLELVINTETGEAFASQSAIARMVEVSKVAIRKWLSSNQMEVFSAEIQTAGGMHSAKLFNETQILRAFAKYKPNLINNFSDFIKEKFHRNIILPELTIKTNNCAPNYLYIIQCTETLVIKIGISNNPLKRLKALQTSYPYELNLIKKIKTKHCRQKEKQLHSALEPLKLKGEWFDGLALSLIEI